MKVIMTGATGFIGQAVFATLRERGDEVVVLTRSVDRARKRLGVDVEAAIWDASTAGPWMDVFKGADAVINLAGEAVVDKRWTEERKGLLVSSRIDSTKAIVDAIEQADPRPRVLINASAIGYYGSQGDQDLTESSPAGTDFLASLVEQWEAAARPVEQAGVRLVVTRSGIVLGGSGGALPRMELPFRLFAGGTMGEPDQWVSWIHLADEVGIILFALDHETVQGPMNLTAPYPVTMDIFCQDLGKALGRPSWVPLLGKAIKIVLGERAQFALASQRVLPKVAEEAGYQFRHTSSSEALRSILADHG